MRLTRILALAALTLPLYAESDENWNNWFMYFGDHPISKSRWGVHLEGQWRRAGLGATWQQLLVRPGVNFQVTPNLSLTLGYGFIESYPYGDIPAAGATPEHRVFQQVLYNRKIRNLDFSHRFRLEQRNIGVLARQPDGNLDLGTYRYENRIRYQIRTNIPLKFGDGKNFIGLYNEIKFNFGKNVEKNVFDQNRAFISIGRTIARDTRAEFGFLEQTLQRRGGQVFEHNHTLQIAITSRIPFF